MPANLILAAALAATPLPAGKGLITSAPLDVASPPGAVATVRFRDHLGEERQASCVAPCRLAIPQGAPFRLLVERDGRAAQLPPVRWAPGMWRTYKLEPARVAATFGEGL